MIHQEATATLVHPLIPVMQRLAPGPSSTPPAENPWAGTPSGSSVRKQQRLTWIWANPEEVRAHQVSSFWLFGPSYIFTFKKYCFQTESLS